MERIEDGVRLEFAFDRFLAAKEDDGDVVREVAAKWPDDEEDPPDGWYFENNHISGITPNNLVHGKKFSYVT